MLYCLTLNKFGIIDEHNTVKGFTNLFDNLDGKEYFKAFNGDKLIAKVLLDWKKKF